MYIKYKVGCIICICCRNEIAVLQTMINDRENLPQALFIRRVMAWLCTLKMGQRRERFSQSKRVACDILLFNQEHLMKVPLNVLNFVNGLGNIKGQN